MTDQNLPNNPELEQLRRLQRIFMPSTLKRILDLYSSGEPYARFVHYTSAEVALRIINSKRIWMRNTNCMSDFSEVNHGYDILYRYFNNNNGSNRDLFMKALDDCIDGVAKEAIGLFDQWWHDIRFNTYITSVSEQDVEEDYHGSLSMWRAFGGNTTGRVALVIKVPYVSQGSQALKLQFGPVAYLKEEEVHDELNIVIQNIRNDREFLSSIGRQPIVNMLFYMLMTKAVCLKHKGFHEEREWRAIYAPNLNPSPLMESSTQVIGGIPQPIYEIPIDKTASPILDDLDLSKLLDRLIIGPSPYPWVMYKSFERALTEAGVDDAGSKVIVSDIPIRT